jgi:hypothetical protein
MYTIDCGYFAAKLIIACFLTGCGIQTTATTVKAQETPVQTAGPTAQQIESESMTETTHE